MDDQHILALATLAYRAGWRDTALTLQATAIAMTVNPTADPEAVVGNRWGLWQLTATDTTSLGITDPKQLLDPTVNADTAYKLYQAHGFAYWPQYGGAAYKANGAIVQQLTLSPGWGLVSAGNTWNPLSILVNAFKSASSGVTGAANGVQNALSGITGIFGSLEGAAEGAVGVVLAVALLALGVWMIGRRLEDAQ